MWLTTTILFSTEATMHINGKQYEQEHIIHLIREIDHLKTLIQPHDTGHIHTTIATLERRVQELMSSHND